jgi:integrase
VLSELKIKAAKPGMHSDGGGLYLQVTTAADGALRKSWLYRFQLRGRRREMGLGALADVPARVARQRHAEARAQVLAGADPIEQRHAARAVAAEVVPVLVTFEAVALAYIARHRASWSNAKHAAQWESTLRTYAFPTFGALPVADVADADVRRVLDPIWHAKTETATRLRSRIELILDAARADGHRTGENPARWRGHLDKLLPAPRKVSPVQHHAALPFADAPAFMSALDEHTGASALCLRWAVLTACRSGEALGARWAEIDADRGLWTVPGTRTKNRREHRVPLSLDAMAVLAEADAVRQNEFVFPGVRSGQPMSDMALTMLLRDVWPGVTVHGFRSTFRDWAAETTSYPSDMCELALGHTVGSSVERAYRRQDMFERRRALMDDWATWCLPAQTEPA